MKQDSQDAITVPARASVDELVDRYLVRMSAVREELEKLRAAQTKLRLVGGQALAELQAEEGDRAELVEFPSRAAMDSAVGDDAE